MGFPFPLGIPFPWSSLLCGVQGGIVSVGVMSGSTQRLRDSPIDDVVAATYLMSPMLVIAYAIAGTVAIDFTSTPLGKADVRRTIKLANFVCQ